MSRRHGFEKSRQLIEIAVVTSSSWLSRYVLADKTVASNSGRSVEQLNVSL